MIIFKSFSLNMFLQFGRKYYYEWINAAIIVLVMCMSSSTFRWVWSFKIQYCNISAYCGIPPSRDTCICPCCIKNFETTLQVIITSLDSHILFLYIIIFDLGCGHPVWNFLIIFFLVGHTILRNAVNRTPE